MTSTLAETPTPAPPPKPGRVRRQLTDRDRAERRLGLYLVAPAVLVMAAVTLYPILYSIWLSMQRYNLRLPDDRGFVWFGNYARILSSGVFWQTFGTTMFITVVSVLIELVIGLAFALVMHRAIFGRRTVRTAILVPYGIITVVAAFAFLFAFSPDQGGFVNALFGIETPLLTTRSGSLFVIILTEIWKTTPFISLLLLAGLATVPEELQEAARVDGATAWQRLWRVTLPNMRGAILVAVLFRTLDAVRVFDTVFIQTRGANDTATLSQLGYNQLINQVNLGMGSAVSVLLFLLVILIAFIFVKVLRTNLGQVRGDR